MATVFCVRLPARTRALVCCVCAFPHIIGNSFPFSYPFQKVHMQPPPRTHQTDKVKTFPRRFRFAGTRTPVE
uniref:Putative secreted protein n=1 Tax=Anopheles darlingi TaxID=43151 RepID=A0A2M4D906_ANODA